MVCTARFGNGPLGSVAQHCDGLARYHELPQVNGYPFHPSNQDTIFVGPLLDEGRPIEQAEQSEHLSHWQRYLAMTSNLNGQHVKCKCVLTSFREPVP